MELLIQPEGSKTCGHHCLAMLSGEPLENIVAIVGHTKGTYTREIVLALRKLGIEPIDTRMVRINKKTNLQTGVYILSIRWDKSHYHWVLLANGFVYDPGSWHSGIYMYSEYLEFLQDKGKITSYLKVY